VGEKKKIGTKKQNAKIFIQSRDTERRDFLSPNIRSILKHGKQAVSIFNDMIRVEITNFIKVS
jgi:hypothetical protein